MPANFQEAIPFILLALALLVALWVVFRASRKTKVIGEQEGDVLDEGVGPASRNQALIDTAPAVSEDSGVPLEAPAKDPMPSAEPAATTAQTKAGPAASGTADDLKRIKGLGPKLVTILAEQGITRFEQIAAWSDADVERIDASLGRFAGRVTRDKWVEQAKLLVSGDESEFKETFGNNG